MGWGDTLSATLPAAVPSLSRGGGCCKDIGGQAVTYCPRYCDTRKVRGMEALSGRAVASRAGPGGGAVSRINQGVPVDPEPNPGPAVLRGLCDGPTGRPICPRVQSPEPALTERRRRAEGPRGPIYILHRRGRRAARPRGLAEDAAPNLSQRGPWGRAFVKAGHRETLAVARALTALDTARVGGTRRQEPRLARQAPR